MATDEIKSSESREIELKQCRGCGIREPIYGYTVLNGFDPVLCEQCYSALGKLGGSDCPSIVDLSFPEDPIDHPPHYMKHPSGIECIQVTEHMNFCLGNTVKYIWRAGLKGKESLEDLKKARWYINREIRRLTQ